MSEVVEQDTIDSEEIPNLLEFMLPSDGLNSNYSVFGFSYNKRIIDGWVKQPSACCGAAAVAGAWNSLLCYHRQAPSALSHLHVLQSYKEIFDDMIYKKQSAFERKLGAKINKLFDILISELADMGREIGGKKGFGATKLIVNKIINKICREHYKLTGERSESMDMKSNLDVLDCLVDLMNIDGFVFTAEEEGKVGDGKTAEDNKESDNEVSI